MDRLHASLEPKGSRLPRVGVGGIPPNCAHLLSWGLGNVRISAVLISVALGVGFLTLFGACREAVERLGLRRHGVWVLGEVITSHQSVPATTRGTGPTITDATIQFSDEHGKIWVIESRSYLGGSSHAVGAVIPVRYRPEHPKHARVATRRSWLTDVAFPTIVGLAVITVGVLMETGVLR